MNKKTDGKVSIIIPARYGSTRFPGKPLAKINGKPMIYYVYKQAEKSKLATSVIIATDEERIFKAVVEFGGNVIYTSKNHESGTDRIAEIAESLPDNCEIIVNIQCDEPQINPLAIDQMIEPLLKDHTLVMSTLITRIQHETELYDSNVVKVVKNRSNFALYFSRSLIPYQRGDGVVMYYKHLGAYAYRRNFLIKYSNLKPTPLEISEKLEQLRVLENGYNIKLVETDYNSISVDTPEDLEKVQLIMENECKIL